jgi:hypothetical protein
VKSLIFGEDVSSDPVGRIIGFCLYFLSRGQIRINVQHLSQVPRLLPAVPHPTHIPPQLQTLPL